jgi:hypothetical protein
MRCRRGAGVRGRDGPGAGGRTRARRWSPTGDQDDPLGPSRITSGRRRGGFRGLLASAHALRALYGALLADGDTRAMTARMLGFAEMNAFLGLDELTRRLLT